jgi:hypothetical protein
MIFSDDRLAHKSKLAAGRVIFNAVSFSFDSSLPITGGFFAMGWWRMFAVKTGPAIVGVARVDRFHRDRLDDVALEVFRRRHAQRSRQRRDFAQACAFCLGKVRPRHTRQHVELSGGTIKGLDGVTINGLGATARQTLAAGVEHPQPGLDFTIRLGSGLCR